VAEVTRNITGVAEAARAASQDVAETRRASSDVTEAARTLESHVSKFQFA
jgi:methyl-accepting chemotaxis protein